MIGKGEMTVREAGRIGGNIRKAGGADYSQLGRVGGNIRKAGGADYSQLGREGGKRLGWLAVVGRVCERVCGPHATPEQIESLLRKGLGQEQE